MKYLNCIQTVGIILFNNENIIHINKKAIDMCNGIINLTISELKELYKKTELIDSSNNKFECKIYISKIINDLNTDEFVVEMSYDINIKSKEYMNLIIENSYGGFFDWDIKEDTEYMSPSFWKMFGYEPYEKTHKSSEWQSIIYPEDLIIANELFNEQCKKNNKNPYDLQLRYYHKNGSTVHVKCTVKIIEWDKDNNPLRMVGTNVNITEYINQIEKLIKYEIDKQVSEKKYDDKMKIVNYIFHEVRNPLHTITIGIETIKNICKSKDIDEIVDVINGSINRTTKILNDTLDYSKLEKNNDSNKNIFNISRINFSNVLNNLFSEYKIQANSLNIKLYKDIEDNLYINADKDRIIQVIGNLLSNSLKFTEPKGKIYIQLDKNKNNIDFVLEDTGCGISEENIEKIVEPYNTVKAGYTNSKVNSIGIGLSIVKKILNGHGQDLIIDSVVGTGTKMKFSFLNCDEVDEVDEVDKKSTIKMKKILLVDDDSNNNFVMKKLLNIHGFHVDVMVDGKEVIDNIDKIINEKYDIILLDYLMKYVNGDQVLKSCRNLFMNKIAMISGCTTQEDKDIFIKLGADIIFDKPLNIEKLIKYINI